MNTKSRNRIKIQIERARAAYVRYEKAERAVFQAIEDGTGITDLSDFSSNAENAPNIEQAIACYIAHGEYGVDNILDELEAADAT